MRALKYALQKVPYSDRVPVVLYIVREDADEIHTPVTTAETPRSPQQKIHSHLIRNRDNGYLRYDDSDSSSEMRYRGNVYQKREIYEGMTEHERLEGVVGNDGINLDGENYDTQSFDNQSLSSMELQQDRYVRNLSSLPRRMGSLSGSSTRVTLDLPYTGSDDRLKNYLNEQNEKFDALISSNLNVVMRKTEKSPAPKNNVVRGFIDGVFGAKKSTKVELEGASADPVEPVTDEESDIDLFVNSLDHDSKARLYRKLQREMESLKEDRDPLEKFQSFMIVSIKLYVLLLRLIIPLLRYLWSKFESNELYLVNSKNTQNLFDFILRLMHKLEAKLNPEERQKNSGSLSDSSRRNSSEELKQLDSLYEEYTMKASNALLDLIANKLLGGSENPSWKRTVVEYVFRPQQTTNVPEHVYATDPQYSKFYSKNTRQTSVAEPKETLPMSMLKAAELFVDEF